MLMYIFYLKIKSNFLFVPFSVEPQDAVMARLQKSVQLNSLEKNVFLVHNAISDQPGLPVEFSVNYDANYGGVSARAKYGDLVHGHKVELTTTMDHLMNVTLFSQCVLIMDIGKSVFMLTIYYFSFHPSNSSLEISP